MLASLGVYEHRSNALFQQYSRDLGIGTSIELIKLHGVTSVSAPGVPKGPRGFRLEANFPNSFKASTRIVYELPANLRVRLDLFDMNGQ